MLTMDQIHHIRELYYGQGITNISSIAEMTGHNRKTVTKYIDMEDFSSPPPKPFENDEHTSKLDPYKPIIDSWLIADKKAPRKQRHNAKRVFRRLSKEIPGFDCSYRTVAAYVSLRKKELMPKNNEGYIPLVHRPGEAQADFGSADFKENGTLYSGKYLVVSFPYSNGGYLQLNYGENMECLLEGLTAVFRHIGGVPTEIWFDNTSTIVTDIIRGGSRKITERFQRFCDHYRFRPVFMNPESGWEKGNVENKVGYLRRNQLVPVPAFISLADYNRHLLDECDIDMEREHYEYDNGIYISDLFKEDKAALLPLPATPYDTSTYITVLTDKYGQFKLNKGLHTYSASPGCSETEITVRLTSSTVTVLDAHMKEIACHRRLYGDSKQSSMDWLPYLNYIARKPRSLRNSGIYDMMPEGMQRFMDDCDNSERGRVLKVLSELTERSGFDSALHTVNEALVHGGTDPDSLRSLYNRLYADVPQLPPLDNVSPIPSAKIIPFNGSDLKKMDAALKKGGVLNG